MAFGVRSDPTLETPAPRATSPHLRAIYKLVFVSVLFALLAFVFARLSLSRGELRRILEDERRL